MAKGKGTLFAKKGTMVAYQGDFRFEKIFINKNKGGLVAGVMNQITRHVTNEHIELMKITGEGVCYLADNAHYVKVLTLHYGEKVYIESGNLLAYTDTCNSGVEFVGNGIVSKRGLFTSTIEALCDGAQVAIKSDGKPIILQTPCKVDPDALLCWTGPNPEFKTAVTWKTLIGQTSGESYILDFRVPGHIVYVQPSEKRTTS